VGEGAEQRLWQRGVQSWAHLRRCGKTAFSFRKWQQLQQELVQAEIALEARLADYFLSRLHGATKARILRDFADDICFLDIETEGLSRSARITTVALLRGDDLRVYVRGRDLHEALPVLAHAPVLVSFNGTRFDLPRLRKEFGLNLGQAHLDLLPILRAMGLHGGQKAIEKQCRVARIESDGVDGAKAVELWKCYESNTDSHALQRLCAYNAEDVLVLKTLLTRAFNSSVSAFPLDVSIPPFGKEERAQLLRHCSLTIE